MNETLLLTGATGFLGSAIAAELLEHRAQTRLLFLVRAPDRETGLARLRESIAVMVPDAGLLDKISADMVVCGELGDFSAQLADSRVRSVSHILNAAALASFAWKQEIWDVNVERTESFVKAVATLPELRRFLYVGTAMISGDTAGRLVAEDEFPADVRQFVPYTKSKAEIERRLPTALADIPLVIARPSVVVGHTRIGCGPSPSIFWIFRMIHAAKRIPFRRGLPIDIVPVDYCARALVHLMFKPDLAHTRYHVSASTAAACSFEEIDAAYSVAKHEHAGALAEVDVAGLAAMEDRFGEWFGPCDTRRMMSAIRVYKTFAGLGVTFDNSRLLSEGMEAPPRFTQYIERCVRTGESEPIAEQMLYDFR